MLYWELVTVSHMIVNEVLTNWKKYAYIDNPKCAAIYMNKLLKKILKRELKPTEKTAIYHEVINILKSFGFNTRIVQGSRGRMLEICERDMEEG